jgi:hypothetical protein
VHWSVKQIQELVASHRGTTDAAAARRFEGRSLRFNDAKATIWGAFTQDDYAVAKAAMIERVSCNESRVHATAANERGPLDGGRDPLAYTPYDQRLYDAFMEMCRTPSGSSGRQNGNGADKGEEGEDRGHTGRGDRFRPTVVVHADLGLLTGLYPNGVADLAGVGPISTEVARRLACDAKVLFSVEHGDGSILDQKRARRSPTTAQRIEIARRDRGCRFASCGFVDFTQVHHMVHWIHGGETNLANLITLCGRHHRAVHELGWTMSGSADGIVTFEGPHGHKMTSAPSPTWRRAGSPPTRRRDP